MSDYYVDATLGDDEGTGEIGDPWQTITKVNSVAFSQDDIVHFKRDEIWSGTELWCDNSGIDGHYITYQDYGSGGLPIIKNPGSSLERDIRITADYVKIRYLDLQDNHEACVYIQSGGDHNIVEYCEMSNGGAGVYSLGEYTMVRYNYIHDLLMVVNTEGGDDDYGATGVWLRKSYSEAHHNLIENCVQDSYDYGKDGGAFEVFMSQDVTDIKIHHNWMYNCAGLIEVAGGYTLTNCSIYYNVWIDGWSTMLYANPPVVNFQFYNNTCIDTITTSDYSYIGFGGAGSSEFKFKNNIFFLLGSWSYVCNSTGEGWSWTHDHNCYYGNYGNLGFTLGTGEMESDPKLVDVKGAGGELIAESFEGAGYENDWDETEGVGSIVDPDSADVTPPTGGGSQILKIQKISPNFDARAEYDTDSDNSITTTTFYVQITAEGIINAEKIYLFRGVNSSWQVPVSLYLYQESDNLYFQFRLYNDGDDNWYNSDNPINLDTWYKIDVEYDTVAETWAWEVDDVPQDSGTLTGTYRNGPRYFYLGDASYAKTLTAYFDLVSIDIGTGYTGDVDDFHLQSDSPCRNAGVDVGLTEDYDGVSVPQETNPCIGAFEFLLGGAGYSVEAKNAMLNALGGLAVYASLHDDDPGATGENELSGGDPSYVRKAIGWNPATGGVIDSSNQPVFDIPTGKTIKHMGLWSAITGGTFYLSAPIVNEAFASQGTHVLTDGDLDLNA